MSITLQLRPPLTAAARRGALLGGSVGFGLLTLGWTLFVTPIVLGIAATAAAFFFASLSGGSVSTTSGAQDILGSLLKAGFAVPLVASVIVGAAIMVVSVIVSVRILRSHSVKRAWGVTWTGIGISIVASWIVGWVLGGIGTTIASALGDPKTGLGTAYYVTVGVTALVVFAADVVIGSVVWWWMAHVLRPLRYA